MSMKNFSRLASLFLFSMLLLSSDLAHAKPNIGGGTSTGGGTSGGFTTGVIVPGGGGGGGGGGKLCAGTGANMATCPGICPMPNSDPCLNNLCATSPSCASGDTCTYFSGSYSPVTSGCFSCATGNFFSVNASLCSKSPPSGSHPCEDAECVKAGGAGYTYDASGNCCVGPNPTDAQFCIAMTSCSTGGSTTLGTTTGGSTTTTTTTTGGSTTSPVCKAPEQDDGMGGCKFFDDRQRCDEGTGGIPASAVSTGVSGADAAARFRNTVNKKLACCLNGFTPGDFYSKFDCIENSKTVHTDFNSLWSSSDAGADGGQMNAMILANSLGKPLTGFYSLDGVRCNEFNEFAGDLQPARVNPGTGNAAQMNHANGSIKGDVVENVGLPLEVPTSAAYTQMKAKQLTLTKGVPTAANDRRRCPILVRAALSVQCPSNPMPPAVQRSYDQPVGTATQRRCATASSIQVQVRVEQLTEIAGMPKMKAEDTVVDQKNAATISIDRIIANKYGNLCPPGSHRSGDACVED